MRVSPAALAWVGLEWSERRKLPLQQRDLAVLDCASQPAQPPLWISIADDGAGIPEEIRESVFLPFFTTKEVGRGTGQSLAIAHAIIVGKHAGSLSFESTIGRGTTFTIRLPTRDPT